MIHDLMMNGRTFLPGSLFFIPKPIITPVVLLGTENRHNFPRDTYRKDKAPGFINFLWPPKLNLFQLRELYFSSLPCPG